MRLTEIVSQACSAPEGWRQCLALIESGLMRCTTEKSRANLVQCWTLTLRFPGATTFEGGGSRAF